MQCTFNYYSVYFDKLISTLSLAQVDDHILQISLILSNCLFYYVHSAVHYSCDLQRPRHTSDLHSTHRQDSDHIPSLSQTLTADFAAERTNSMQYLAGLRRIIHHY